MAYSPDTYESDNTMSTAKDLLLNNLQNHTLHVASDIDYVVFTAMESGYYTFSVQSENAVDFDILSVDGKVLDSADSAAIVSELRLTAGTRVYLRVQASNSATTKYSIEGSNSTGKHVSADSYENDNSMENAKLISINSAQTHTIHVENDVDWVYFTATAANLTISTTGDADMVIKLYDRYGAFVTMVDGKNATLQYDFSGQVGNKFYAQISSYNSYVESYELAVTATDTDAPTRPNIVNSVVDASAGTVYLDWSNSVDQLSEFYYVVEYSLSSDFTTSVISVKVSSARSEYTIASGLVENSTYYWRVQAVDVAGNASAWSSTGHFFFPGTGPQEDQEFYFGSFSSTNSTQVLEIVGTSVVLRNPDGSATNFGALEGNWKIAGVEDFNGDGFTDVLLRDGATGACAFWMIEDGAISSVLGSGSAPNPWEIVGVGDLNNDGNVDILLRDTNDGGVVGWLLKDGVYSSAAGTGYAPDPWDVVGVGDFNGDGTDDVLLTNTETGDVACWMLKDGAYDSAAGVGVAVDSWEVVGVGDFNGDGTDDVLLWDTANGGVACWIVKDGTYASASGVGFVEENWAIVGLGDFNNDGTCDVALQYAGSDEVYAWTIKNGTYQDAIRLA